MPEVKVKWADPLQLHDDKRIAPREVRLYGWPVLTLDQLEAWLKQENERSITFGGYNTINDLLAQVQAWKGGGK